MSDQRCNACNGQGYLEVCIGVNSDGSDAWENQWCQECHIILPDYDPPEIE